MDQYNAEHKHCGRNLVDNPRAVVTFATNNKYKIVLNIIDSSSVHSRQSEINLATARLHLLRYNDTLP
jgi:hypothetical protein